MIIVGLGNPGVQYESTRHNVGFIVLDQLASKIGIDDWKKEFGVLSARIGPHWLIKPQEFMNVSGQTLKGFFQKKGITPIMTDLIVVHDDLDFPVGTIKQTANQSSAGHQGVQSIIETFGTQDFQRLRIGVGDNRAVNLMAEEYVLQPFPKNDRPAINEAIAQAVDRLKNKLE